MTITSARRCADCDKNRVSCRYGRSDVRRKGEAPSTCVVGNEVIETRLKDRNRASVQRRNLLLVFIDAGYVVTKISKASTRDEPNVAAANHCDAHQNS